MLCMKFKKTSSYFRHEITVQEPVKDWRSGDIIVVASTDYDFQQAERFTVTKVSQDGFTINFEGEVCFQRNKLYCEMGLSHVKFIIILGDILVLSFQEFPHVQ